MRAVLLPGLDGTGDLFEPFVDASPGEIATQVVSYPGQTFLGYPALRELVAARLPSGEPWILIAESFSTPLAVALAAESPPGLVALVLCAGFVTPPAWPGYRFLARPWAFKIPIPVWVMRRYLLGGEADRWKTPFRSAVRRVAPAVLAGRIRQVLSVDYRDRLSRCGLPILYIRATCDRLVPERSYREIQALSPGCELCEIESPHFVLQHSPVSSWSCIQSFVASRLGVAMSP